MMASSERLPERAFPSMYQHNPKIPCCTMNHEDESEFRPKQPTRAQSERMPEMAPARCPRAWRRRGEF